MWRTLRKVFWNRSGNPANLRLGQVQVAEKNDEVNPLPLSLEKERIPRHGKALLQEHDLAQLEEGFNLVRSILIRARREEKRKIARLMFFVGEEKEEEQAGCGTIIDEIKLWFTGVLALTSILSCRHFIFDEDHKIDIRRIPQALYYLTIHNPRSALAVLPVVHSDQASLEDSNSKSLSLNEAASSFQTTSDECTAQCQNKLGVKYAARRQYQEAFALFQQASVHGHSLAQFNLGLCYENGKGIDRDLEKAAECYKKAAALNHSGALYNLALFHMDGIGTLPKDQTRALELLELAAKAGMKKAQSYLGIYYANESSKHVDYAKAVSYLEKAAHKKDAAAEYHLGICYERGLGVERDLKKAGQLYESAANHGSVSAQHNLGVFYQHGLGGLPVDHKEALRYYRMAAEAGDEDAHHNCLQLMEETSSEKRVNSLVPFVGNDILLAFFQQMTFKQNNEGILRCSSSPELIDQQVNSQDIQPKKHDSGRHLVAF
ncbi:uncharacterized protein LOC116308817 [Actinia tenebrosa]|uniref:Uncharacterized protein LOC116308817 n=1 Tax=Actinia tenebrosa TaxID=6105 RepID=A0A6P8J520_ACTTE|nr:uncharacterized protein LOC116308817 [Actinia tenebrosa]